MPAIDLQHGPPRLTAAVGGRLEAKARALDVSAWDLPRESWSFHRLTECTDWQGTQARPNPFKILGIGDAKDIHDRRHFVPIAIVPGILFELLAELRGIQVKSRLPMLGHQCVQVDKAPNPFPCSFGRTADHKAAI